MPKPKILIIDSEKEQREVLYIYIFSKEGYIVKVVEDGGIAKKLLKK